VKLAVPPRVVPDLVSVATESRSDRRYVPQRASAAMRALLCSQPLKQNSLSAQHAGMDLRAGRQCCSTSGGHAWPRSRRQPGRVIARYQKLEQGWISKASTASPGPARSKQLPPDHGANWRIRWTAPARSRELSRGRTPSSRRQACRAGPPAVRRARGGSVGAQQ